MSWVSSLVAPILRNVMPEIKELIPANCSVVAADLILNLVPTVKSAEIAVPSNCVAAFFMAKPSSAATEPLYPLRDTSSYSKSFSKALSVVTSANVADS